jgi:superfamily I DNA/RNA helicase
MGLTDDNLPNKMGFSEEEDDLHITTERRLLYTCMTRACKTLTLTYAGEKSRYLSEIDKELLRSL